jgi:hypothetical protein
MFVPGGKTLPAPGGTEWGAVGGNVAAEREAALSHGAELRQGQRRRLRR